MTAASRNVCMKQTWWCIKPNKLLVSTTTSILRKWPLKLNTTHADLAHCCFLPSRHWGARSPPAGSTQQRHTLVGSSWSDICREGVYFVQRALVTCIRLNYVKVAAVNTMGFSTLPFPISEEWSTAIIFTEVSTDATLTLKCSRSRYNHCFITQRGQLTTTSS